MAIFFIADLHLSAHQPEITACLLRFLKQDAPTATALYVLGDLFEFWVGDDEQTALQQEVAQAFYQLSQTGTDIYYIHGNRDFLIGQQFATEAGITLLPEHYVIDLFGVPTLIMHGDTLCVQDVNYQKFRKKAHNKTLQRLFLYLPLKLRKKIGQAIRDNSENKHQNRPNLIADVDKIETLRVMKKYQVMQLIHGHTHRQAIHHFEINGMAASRIVLGDWDHQGAILCCTAQGMVFEARPFTSA